MLARLRREDDCAISAITVLELHRALAPEERQIADDVHADVPTLPVDAETAAAAGDYLARCGEDGHRVDFFAGTIAVTAHRHSRTLATYSPFQYPLAKCELLGLSTVLHANE